MEWLLGAAGGKQRAPRALVTVHVYDLGPAFGGVNMVLSSSRSAAAPSACRIDDDAVIAVVAIVFVAVIAVVVVAIFLVLHLTGRGP